MRMIESQFEKVPVLKLKDSKIQIVEDIVAKEKELKISVNNINKINLTCTPTNIKELCIGYLFGSKQINNINDVKEFNISQTVDKITVNVLIELNSNNKTPTPKPIQNKEKKEDKATEILTSVNSDIQNLQRLITEFSTMSDLFLNTGGVHSCGLSDGKSITHFFEDTGRLNALCKVIGGAVIENTDMNGKILFSSGRIAHETINFITPTGITLIVSVSAPTSEAINLSKTLGINLIGFARDNRMNFYI